MIIRNKNAGPKIPYEIEGNKITFDDDLTINLKKREADDPVHIDVCFDRDGELVVGAAAGWKYVAEIDIPARAYEHVDREEEGETASDYVPVPFDINRCTLSLWAIK